MRKLWIKIHLYVAAFFAPMILVMATSGGLYLLGVKGTVASTPVEISSPSVLSIDSSTLEEDVRQLLGANNIEHDFEYIKVSGTSLFTRPTSRIHYEFNLSGETVAVSRNIPDLQKSMVELHKGHGPLLFKDLQKAMALGLLIVVLSGFWLGVSSTPLRLSTLVITSTGLAVFLTLVLAL